MLKSFKVLLNTLFAITCSSSLALSDQYNSSGSKYDLGIDTPKMEGAYGDGIHDDYPALKAWASSGKPLGCSTGVYMTSQPVQFIPVSAWRDGLNLSETPPQGSNLDSGCIIRSSQPMRATCEFGKLDSTNPWQYYVYSAHYQGGVCDANNFALNAIRLIGFLDFTLDHVTAKNPLMDYLALGDVNGPFSAGADIHDFQTLRDQPNVPIASITTGSVTTITTTKPHGVLNHQIVYLQGIKGTNHTGNCTLAGTNSSLNCNQYEAIVPDQFTIILRGVTSQASDFTPGSTGGLVYINFSGSAIPIPLVSVSQASPAVFTCATSCNVDVGADITIYGNFGSTYIDSEGNYTNGVDGGYKVAAVLSPTTFTAYQHDTDPINTLTASQTGKAGVMIKIPIGTGVTGITSATTADVKTGIGVKSVIVGNVGSGFDTTPIVTIAPPPSGGVTAQAIAFESNGVTGLTLVAAGTCTSAPTLEIDGGGGGGAQYTPIYSGGVLTGATQVTAGNSYISPPLVKTIGGGCSGVKWNTTISGVSFGYYVTVPGSGYVTPPVVTITSADGHGGSATATARLTTGNNFQAGDWVTLEQVVGNLDSNNNPVSMGIFQVGTGVTNTDVPLLGLDTSAASAYVSGGVLMPYPGRPVMSVDQVSATNTEMSESTLEMAAIGVGGPVGTTYNSIRPYDMQLTGNHAWGYPTNGNFLTCYDIGGSNKLGTNMCDGPFNFGIRTWAQGNVISTSEFDVASFGVGNTGACIRAEEGARNSYSLNTCQAPYWTQGYTTQCQGAPCNIYIDMSTAYLDPSMYVINNPTVWLGAAKIVQPQVSTILAGSIMEEDFDNPLGPTEASTIFLQYPADPSIASTGYFAISSTTNSIGLNVTSGQSINMSFDYASLYQFTATGAIFGGAAGGTEGPGTINALGIDINGVPVPTASTSNYWYNANTYCDRATGGFGLQIVPAVGYVGINGVNAACGYTSTLFYIPSGGNIYAEQPFVPTQGIRTGSAANTDTAGTVTLVGGSYTLALTLTNYTKPVCSAWDVTSPGTLAYAVSSLTNIVFHGTGTDQVSYHCIGLN